MKTLLAILFCCASVHAMDRFEALSQIESGNRDNVTGASGEISRFQIKKSVWDSETSLPYSSAKNPFTAENVAKSVMSKRVSNFVFHNHRQPTAFETYQLWNPRCPRDTAQRFSNLVNSKTKNQ
jgi:hypothetical protein